MSHPRIARAVARAGLVALSLSAAEATAPEADAAPTPLAPVPTKIVQGDTAFAFDLYARLRAEPGNVFFSPASISTALAMTWAGARGPTAAQMAKTMHFELPPDDEHAGHAALLARLSSSGGGGPELAIANRLWAQKGMPLEAEFLKTTKERYGAPLELLDFAEKPEDGRKAINAWVKSKTNEKIVDLLPVGSIEGLTRLVLTNAIWFKGTWATAFPKGATKDEPFLTAGAPKKVPTMHLALNARYAESDDAQVLELPYRASDPDHATSMVVILPKAKDGLAKVEAALGATKLASLLGGLATAKVDVALPRFTTKRSFELGKTLSSMGMPLAFTEGQADFSGITKKESLHVSRVIHQAFVSVNEEGTEAAAATAVVMATEGAMLEPPPKTFRADHPFVFLIRDVKSGAVLFLGRIVDPVGSASSG